MSDKNQSDYHEQLISLYRGELYGEMLFDALAAGSAESPSAAMWRLAGEVERLTGERLEVRALELAADVEEQRRRASVRLENQLQELSGKNTRELCEYYRERVPVNTKRLRELRAAAPPGDHLLLSQVIAHSEAFGQCLEHWLTGDLAAAEKALRAYLDN